MMGFSNRKIAGQLFLSPETVKTYVSRIFRKLGAATRAQAVARSRSLELFGVQSDILMANTPPRAR
ncbi:MAG: response regulator transcription factor [Thermoleophilia bacterium]|nr:response regulator transcription factor [Thermoleophilia bacterium]